MNNLQNIKTEIKIPYQNIKYINKLKDTDKVKNIQLFYGRQINEKYIEKFKIEDDFNFFMMQKDIYFGIILPLHPSYSKFPYCYYNISYFQSQINYYLQKYKLSNKYFKEKHNYILIGTFSQKTLN